LNALDQTGKLNSNNNNLGRVISGLESKDVKQLRGELFRLRACKELGWENIEFLEESVKSMGGNIDRYIDISTTSGKHIETK